MIAKLHAAIGRFGHWLATPLLRLYTKDTKRVRTLVVSEHQEVLLVRSWFGHQRWSLPGGGIGRHEDPRDAAVRETLEETGVSIAAQSCVRLGAFANDDSSAPFIVDCYLAEISKQPPHISLRHKIEILDAAWFSMDELPAVRSKTVDRALALYWDRAVK